MKRIHLVALGLAAAALLLTPALVQAQTGVMFVKNNRIGAGTDDPQTLVHARSTAGTAKVLVEEASGTSAARELFELRNNGGPFFIFKNSGAGQSWSFALAANHNFLISHQQTAGTQMRLTQTGNMTITGTLTQGSSRAIKNGIEAVDPSEVLDRVAALPVATWRYRGEGAEHLGPMAEDFHAAFGLGTDDRHIAPGDMAGVALAAIQGLHRTVAEKDARIAELETRLASLERMMLALAAD